MDNAVLEHVIDRILKTQISHYPFPHFFIEEVFPEEFYQELLESLPDSTWYQELSKSGAVRAGTYKQRLVFPLEEWNRLPFAHLIFWQRFAGAILSDLFASSLLKKFDRYIKDRFGDQAIQYFPNAGLVRDQSDYSIGPHTDHPDRVLSFLFYLPRNKNQSHLGTSIYCPADPTFKCEGLKHHSFQGFHKVFTAPFIPNSMFGFLKSEHSFHGVEPIGEQKEERNLMSYSLHWTKK